jgi:hypothetical protein
MHTDAHNEEHGLMDIHGHTPIGHGDHNDIHL